MTRHDVDLPPLSDRRVAAMEDAIFAAIAREETAASPVAAHAPGPTLSPAVRPNTPPRRRVASRYRRAWAGLVAAASVAVVALAGPTVLATLAGAGASSTAGGATESAPARGGSAYDAPGSAAADGDASATPVDSADTRGREVAVTSWATLTVTDPAAAADEVSSAARAVGGYVESMNVLADGENAIPEDGGVSTVESPGVAAWVTVRVPAGELDSFTAALGELGTVTATQVDRQDVTDGARDLRARVAALETSVARLTELMGESGSVGDLLAAEEALAQRQAELDSARQQLAQLDRTVAMSTVTVNLNEKAPASQADPARFGDGLTAGWNGLIAVVNGLVVALGFALPWLAIAAVAAGIVWVVRRRRRRERPPTDTSD
ncbi:DUF4349 domain-containing protein [Microbacterium sp.]|uniref:DUF4349 domain-containing protein n=1 Tax=Microbacterium sp. TaxID=51671 RepID=UPI003A84E55A